MNGLSGLQFRNHEGRRSLTAQPVVAPTSGAGLPQRQGRREDGQDGRPTARSVDSAVPARHMPVDDPNADPYTRLCVQHVVSMASAGVMGSIICEHADELPAHSVGILLDKITSSVETMRRNLVLFRSDTPLVQAGRLLDVKA